MKRLHLPSALVLALVLCLAAPVPVAALQEGEPETTGETRKQRKQREKDERIAEYLRKKEERRSRREMERQLKTEREAQEAAMLEAEAAAMESGVTDEMVVEGTSKRGRRSDRQTALPRELERIQGYIWDGPLGQDPTVQSYLLLIERGEATAHQIAAFGNFLGEAGMTRAAIAYYDLALHLEREDTVLWLNVGTLQRQLGEYKHALGAYSRALDVDPNNAYAHYNLGAVLDLLGNYEDAVEEYKIALTLDPGLGDPAINPQAANNDRLVAVKLMLYQDQAGSLGLPLVQVPGGELDEPVDEPAQSEDAADRR